jgi:hypothetical protein
MKSYIITEEQYITIINQKFDGIQFNPLQCVDGHWHIWEKEKIYCESEFGWVLTESSFIPPETTNTIIPS